MASVGGKSARYVRFTATRLSERTRDYIFALGEMQVIAADASNLAKGAKVAALDSIEAPPRWRAANLTDEYHYGIEQGEEAGRSATAVADLKKQRRALLERAAGEELGDELARAEAELATIDSQIDALPRPTGMVFAAATTFRPIGGFAPTSG